jgi:hypothetical protein
MSTLRRLLLISALFYVAHPVTVAAQTFEGTVRQRTAMVPPAALSRWIAADVPFATIAQRVFAAPIDSLLPPGEVERMRSPDGSMVMEQVWHFKDGKMRMDMQIPGMPAEMGFFSIMDPQRGEIVMVMPMLKQVMRLPNAQLDSMQRHNTNQARKLGVSASMQPRRIGTQIINGMQAVGYEMHDTAFVARLWMAEELRDVGEALRSVAERMRGMAGTGAPGMMDDPMSLIGQPGLPLRIQSLMRVSPEQAQTMGPGYMYTVMEVVSIERKTLSDTLFRVPQDYTEMKRPQLPQQSPPRP